MEKKDRESLDILRKLIEEVKREMSSKKVLTESKTPEKIFESHQKNIKEYVLNNVWNTIKNSTK